MMEEDHPVKKRTKKQIEEDRLGEELAHIVHDVELADQDRN